MENMSFFTENILRFFTSFQNRKKILPALQEFGKLLPYTKFNNNTTITVSNENVAMTYHGLPNEAFNFNMVFSHFGSTAS